MHYKKTIFILIFSLLISFQNSSAQDFQLTGIVIEAKSKKPIAYVNIGIPDKGIGTVSDAEGNFTLHLQSENENDPLKFSMIGYESRSFLISKLKEAPNKNENYKHIINLEEKPYQLNEITITDKKAEFDTLGSNKISSIAYYYFYARALGAELGRIINIKKSPAHLQSLQFNIRKNDFDSVTFRVNIYSINKKKLPGDNILNRNIVFTTSAKEGNVTFDLRNYSVTVNEDFIITLEALQLYGEKKAEDVFRFAAQMPGMGFGRTISHDKWLKTKKAIIYFKVAVKYI